MRASSPRRLPQPRAGRAARKWHSSCGPVKHLRPTSGTHEPGSCAAPAKSVLELASGTSVALAVAPSCSLNPDTSVNPCAELWTTDVGAIHRRVVALRIGGGHHRRCQLGTRLGQSDGRCNRSNKLTMHP